MEAIDSVGLARFRRSVTRRAIFVKSELEGCPVCELKGAAAVQAWQDYQAIGKELMKAVKNG
jgi:chromosome partitioning protein